MEIQQRIYQTSSQTAIRIRLLINDEINISDSDISIFLSKTLASKFGQNASDRAQLDAYCTQKLQIAYCIEKDDNNLSMVYKDGTKLKLKGVSEFTLVAAVEQFPPKEKIYRAPKSWQNKKFRSSEKVARLFSTGVYDLSSLD